MLSSRSLTTTLAVCSFAVLLSHQAAMAALSVASPFTDNAVLQRDTQIPVWGTSDAGGTVTVKFAGQTKSTVAGANGKWTVQLDPMPANAEPQVLHVSDSTSGKSFTNVVIGEVWICSGQSNMQFGVNAVPEAKALIPKTKNIRLSLIHI